MHIHYIMICYTNREVGEGGVRKIRINCKGSLQYNVPFNKNRLFALEMQRKRISFIIYPHRRIMMVDCTIWSHIR